MFRRPEPEQTTAPVTTPSKAAPAMSQTTPAVEPTASASVIGQSLHVKGTVTGSQDLLVEGVVEGGICLSQNIVTVGKSGRVQATIEARMIHVEGEVQGDLIAVESVVVHRTGSVRGNITAPRVTLEDGARLKGAIDTDSTLSPATKSSTNGKVEADSKTPKKSDSSLTTNSPVSASV